MAHMRIDLPRLLDRLAVLGRIGALPGGGVCRLALTAEDRQARDQLVGWMQALGLAVSVDAIGNIFGVRAGRQDGPPVMVGSHIDTVATGGLYDGALGVMAGLELVETLNDADIETEFPIAVAAFTNEEGARFAPDMMGSLVFAGGLDLAAARATKGIDGALLGDCLDAIGYAGPADAAALRPRAFLELHIEQGPVLDREGVPLAAVTGVQGISWTEYSIRGVSNHAGTTPMALRRDAGYAAAAIACAVRRIAEAVGGGQVGTVGFLEVQPGLINVVGEQARLTVDLRNADKAALQEAERRLAAEIAQVAASEQVTVSERRLARFEPVAFASALVDRIAALATERGHGVRRLASGAGHDAQMMARLCPAAMIFVPSRDGISHNIREHTDPEDLRRGADVLLQLVLELADGSLLGADDAMPVGARAAAAKDGAP